jgi:hypothetical protein
MEGICGEYRKELDIPLFIDDYNYNMGGVDIANQNREVYETQRRVRRNWWPLFYWILDTAIVNAYHLAFLTGKAKDMLLFRQAIFQKLFEFARPARKRKRIDDLPKDRLQKPDSLHQQILYRTRRDCKWCLYVTAENKDLSDIRPDLVERRQVKRKRITSQFGCNFCGVHLCAEKRDCWNNWHKQTE